MGKIKKGSPDYCGSRARKHAPKGFMRGMANEDMLKQLKHVQRGDQLTRRQLCKLLRTKKALHSNDVGVPLTNDGDNSCYLDSVLVGLYHRKSSWLDEHTIESEPEKASFHATHNTFVETIEHIRHFFGTHTHSEESDDDEDDANTSQSNADDAKKGEEDAPNKEKRPKKEPVRKKDRVVATVKTTLANSNSNGDSSNSASYSIRKKTSAPPKRMVKMDDSTRARLLAVIRERAKTVASNSDGGGKRRWWQSGGADGRTCSTLRGRFQGRPFTKFNNESGLEWTETQQDPIEVISMIHHIYNIPDSMNVVEEKTGAKPEDQIWRGVWEVPAYVFTDEDKCRWKKVFPTLTTTHEFEDEHGRRVKQVTTHAFKDAPMLYVKLHRYRAKGENYVRQRKVDTRFVPEGWIETSTRRTLTLVSIIVHIGKWSDAGHYTVFLCLRNGVWVYYDDMAQHLEVIGMQLRDVMAYKNGLAASDGVGLIYMDV
jgi:hypothetical protein